MTTDYTLFHGDCLDVMKTLEADSIDTVLCDPPYGLSFMGKEWDHGVPGIPFWQEALRVAKPGAYLMAFGGTRTYHRLTCAIEDAGWIIKDCFVWVYGSGFPKGCNISANIDREAGAEREVVGEYVHITAPSTPLAQQFDGYNTALKPAYEPVVIAMKPLDGTYAQNAARWGTAGLNIDGGRIPAADVEACYRKPSVNNSSAWKNTSKVIGSMNQKYKLGRWPANLGFVCFCEDESHHEPECPAYMLDQHSGQSKGGKPRLSTRSRNVPFRKKGSATIGGLDNYGDSGGASRFFYCAKASAKEKNFGCEELPLKIGGGLASTVTGDTRTGHITRQQNNHPTVKPIAVMRYLARLSKTPSGGTILDPFMGSGSTGVAALLEGRRFIGIEKEAEYLAIAEARLKAV